VVLTGHGRGLSLSGREKSAPMTLDNKRRNNGTFGQGHFGGESRKVYSEGSRTGSKRDEPVSTMEFRRVTLWGETSRGSAANRGNRTANGNYLSGEEGEKERTEGDHPSFIHR